MMENDCHSDLMDEDGNYDHDNIIDYVDDNNNDDENDNNG